MTGEIRPRRVKAVQPIETPQEVVPRTVRAAEIPAGAMGDRYVNAVEELVGAPDSVLLQAAELLAEELGMTVVEAMAEITSILERKAKRGRDGTTPCRRS